MFLITYAFVFIRMKTNVCQSIPIYTMTHTHTYIHMSYTYTHMTFTRCDLSPKQMAWLFFVIGEEENTCVNIFTTRCLRPDSGRWTDGHPCRSGAKIGYLMEKMRHTGLTARGLTFGTKQRVDKKIHA